MESKAKQRVAIAKDALKWVEAGVLKPNAGAYVIASVSGDKAFAKKANAGKQLRDINLGECEVCAIGACFLAKAVRYDQVSIPEHQDINPSEMISEMARPALLGHFDQDQLELIEHYFEGWTIYSKVLTDVERGMSVAFRVKHPSHTKRMTIILENIIKNNGTFKPCLLALTM